MGEGDLRDPSSVEFLHEVEMVLAGVPSATAHLLAAAGMTASDLAEVRSILLERSKRGEVDLWADFGAYLLARRGSKPHDPAVKSLQGSWLADPAVLRRVHEFRQILADLGIGDRMLPLGSGMRRRHR